eukprot:scaffold291215_cov35-Tisochrysis_lutea.AAC.1
MSFTALAMLLATATGTTPDGLAWLAENAKKEGVVTLPSGLQYKVITEAPAGAKSPLANTPCSCHYRGTLIDGTEFDSSYKRGQPTTFAPNQVRSFSIVLDAQMHGWKPSHPRCFVSYLCMTTHLPASAHFHHILTRLRCSPSSQVVKGWTEAMQLMGEGDKWELYLPSELAYGDRQRGKFITPGAVLIFELEMLEVKGESKAKPK